MAKRLLCLLAFLTISFGYAAPFDYENLQVENIDIQLATDQTGACTLDQVTAKMSTREGNFFSQTEFDQDLKNLSLEFDRVDPYLSIEGGKIKILLKVWPRPLIRSLCYDGNTHIATKKLQKELGIPPLTLFDRRAFNEAFHNLKTYYVKKGYFEAELDYIVDYDECTNEVDIRIVICEGRAGRIESIRFCGFDKCEESEITKKMVTKEYNLFTSWLSEQGTYREDAMQHDQFQIQNYLQNRGYADAQVYISVTESSCNNRIKILITADKGDIYTVDKITFNGNCLFDDETIFCQFAFRPGDPYSPEKIRDTVTNIQELYGKNGYIDAFVNFEPKLECDCSYSVDVQIEEGERYCVGLIKVFGNCTTMTNVILHETLLVPGEVFNTRKLKRTEERLQNIGYFKKVNVYAVKTEDSCIEGNYRDVHVEVEETGTGKISFFGGFSSMEKLFGGLSLSESNFNIQGIPCVWSRGLRALRGGGEYASLSAQFGVRSTSYNLAWTKPYFMDSKWSVGFDIDKSSNTYLDKHLDIDAIGLAVRAGRQLNAFVRFQWHWRIRDSRVDYDGNFYKKDDNGDKLLDEQGNPIMVFKSLDELKGSDPYLYTVEKTDGTVSATGISLSYDSTNSIVCPTKGLRSIFEAELAGLGGQYDFFSFSYRNTWYYPFTDTLVLKYRADLRFLFPFAGTNYDNMPLDERFFLGGDTFVRGYRPYKIGPRFKKLNSEGKVVDSDVSSGGFTLQFLSIELNKKLSERFDGFLFMDLGHLSQDIWNFDWNEFRGSLGFGVRACVLDSLPPISLGMGFPINPRDRSEVKKFFIQFGCKF
ncbi:MAG: outer membrane protein assembly factor BamA [Chlamydiia bacterium]|nr:outer membrane protein assembly factor BamA [Chlamydiia bacterium]